MEQTDFFEKTLIKWPALLVVGKPVTKEQAMEILIRTDPLSLSSNDHKFCNQCAEYLFDIKIPAESLDDWDAIDDAIKLKLGITNDTVDGWNTVWEYKEKKWDEVHQLPELNYLCNHQITSAWIGGPHGWCNWDGIIGTSNYNIGKWPSIEEVYREWREIARAFPFLEITSQLLNCEAGDDTFQNPAPVIEFRIKDGKVEMVEPTELLIQPNHSLDYVYRFTNPYAERGCTFEQFKGAVDYVKSLNI